MHVHFSNLILFWSQQTWCVAKPSASEEELKKIIDFACSELNDCTLIQNNGPCCYPNTLINHASVVMNLYYQKNGRNYWNCDFSSSGLKVLTDPSKSKQLVFTHFDTQKYK